VTHLRPAARIGEEERRPAFVVATSRSDAEVEAVALDLVKPFGLEGTLGPAVGMQNSNVLGMRATQAFLSSIPMHMATYKCHASRKHHAS
jgi:hypothetical protein